MIDGRNQEFMLMWKRLCRHHGCAWADVDKPRQQTAGM
jgi:predicted RNA-binding Zn ribbon-like protein